MNDTLLYAISLLVLPVSALLVTVYFSRLNDRMVENARRIAPRKQDDPR